MRQSVPDQIPKTKSIEEETEPENTPKKKTRANKLIKPKARANQSQTMRQN